MIQPPQPLYEPKTPETTGVPESPLVPDQPAAPVEIADHLARSMQDTHELSSEDESTDSPENREQSPEENFQQLLNEDIQREISQNNYTQPEIEQYMEDIRGVNESISQDIEETLKGIKEGFDQEYGKRNYKIAQRLKVIAKLVPSAGFLTVSTLGGGGLTSLPTLLSAGLFLRQLLSIYQNGEWGGDGEFKRKLKQQLKETNQLAEAAQEDLKSELRDWQIKLSEAPSEERRKLYEKAILDMSAKAQEIMLDIQNPQRRIDKLTQNTDALRNPA